MVQPEGIPTSVESTKQHTNADVNASSQAMHHTLGIGHNEASPGDHSHNGKNSKLIGKGINPAFPTTALAAYNQAQMQSVINALRSLGFGV